MFFAYYSPSSINCFVDANLMSQMISRWPLHSRISFIALIDYRPLFSALNDQPIVRFVWIFLFRLISNIKKYYFNSWVGEGDEKVGKVVGLE
uniref:Uncharacterized protein n=1 Tax=Ascaris lumbricoides TaxID=6252 RepID=A0A0M3IT41_ASCLU